MQRLQDASPRIDVFFFSFFKTYEPLPSKKERRCALFVSQCVASCRVESAQFVEKGRQTKNQSGTGAKMCLLQALQYGLKVGMLSS